MKKFIAVLVCATVMSFLPEVSRADDGKGLSCVFILQQSPGTTGGGSGGPLIRTARLLFPISVLTNSKMQTVPLKTSMDDGLDAGADANGMPSLYLDTIGTLQCFPHLQISAPFIECTSDEDTSGLGSHPHFFAKVDLQHFTATLTEQSVLGLNIVFDVSGSCNSRR